MLDVRGSAAFWHTENPFMFRWSFQSRARHPLIRIIALVLGALALIALLAFGLIAAAALIVGGAIFMLVNALRSAPPANAARAPPPGVIEGEFRVVHDERSDRQAVH
jgi:hypothetical protein